MTITTATEPDAKKTGNAIIGERIHTLMWREGRTQAQLAILLGVDQGSVSKRLKGRTQWSAIEVQTAAAWLGVPVTDLMPEIELAPRPEGPDEGPGGAPSRTRTYDLRIKSP
ncbi:MAG: helix-turn-helix domain-containing protein [Rhodococcus sp. (in: high G+C Gram-positive bacteria)]